MPSPAETQVHSAPPRYVIHFIFSLTLRCEIKNRKVHTLSIIISFRSTVGFRQSFPGGVHIDYSLRYVTSFLTCGVKFRTAGTYQRMQKAPVKDAKKQKTLHP